MSDELKKKLEDFKDIHQRDISDLKRHYESQINNLKSSNERAIELLKSNHNSELKVLQESHSAEMTGIKSKLESQSSLLSTSSIREDEFRSQIASLTKTLQSTEMLLATARKEVEAQKIEIATLTDKNEELQKSINQTTAKYDNIESMFAVEQRRASSLEADYAAQRDQFKNMQDEIQRKTKQIERMERHAKQQTIEITKANSIIKQLQKDLKSAQNKAKLRGQVATEQEKVLTAKEAEAEDALSALREVRDQLHAEESRRERCDAQIINLQTALEEAKRTIKNNENIISWLNRQISESHTQSWQERLKAKGIPVVPSYMADKQPPPPTIPPFGKDSGGKLGIAGNGGLKPTGLDSLSPPCRQISSTSPGSGVKTYSTSPAISSLGGKENTLPMTCNHNVNTGAASSAPGLLNGVASEIAALTIRSPAPLISLTRQQPESSTLHSLSKTPQNVGTSLASECESSLSRPPNSNNQHHSSLLSSYFHPKPTTT
nr:spindle assembly abnormal protein 6 [Hymenolepis microstoma]